MHDDSRIATSHYEIDLARDELLPLGDVPRWLRRRGARAPHVSAPYRWAQKGIRGLRLPVARIGGRTYTSTEALNWWSKVLAEAAVATGVPARDDPADDATLRAAGLEE